MKPSSATQAAASAAATPPMPRRAGRERDWWLAVVAVTLLAGALRLVAVRQVPLNLFYDAAVRSMGQSWHNFFYGAFDPSASAAVDKPPFDLWLQVLSTKILGFNSTALHLPQALCSTLAVPLLYDTVRRVAGRVAALASALVLAVLPLSVLTARSDTMDSVMMLVLVGVTWLLVLAYERRQLRWLLAAAALLGVDFNVKLFEALIAAPALVVFAWPVLAGASRRRVRWMAATGAVFLVSALWWIAAVSLTPAGDRPYPIGSTDGTVWNAVFVYNGVDRITQPATPDRFTGLPATIEIADTQHAGPAPLVAARHVSHRAPPKSPAGPLRLFQKTSLDYGGLIGELLLAGLMFGAAALLVCRPRLWPRDEHGRRTLASITLAGAALAGTAVWLLTSYLLFSASGRTHPRYLEAFTPAVAIAAGVGIVALARRAREPMGLAALLLSLIVTMAYAAVVTGVGSIVQVGLVIAVVFALLTAGAGAWSLAEQASWRGWPSWWNGALAGAGVLAAVLTFAVARDVRVIHNHAGDQAAAPHFSSSTTRELSGFLLANQGSSRYELAAIAPSVAAPIIARDGRPVLLLTSYQARPLVTLGELKRYVARGSVRYLVTRGGCHPYDRALPACAAATLWATAHGRDVSAWLGPSAPRRIVYQLP